MRAVIAVAVAAGGTALGGGLVACFDLLHGTGGLLTACEIDASSPGCSPPEATTVCASSDSEARSRAEHACAWLGACETPMGGNAFGHCMFSALLAFDCTANPNHRVHGKEASLWACLARAKTCDDVDRCVFPSGTQVCETAADHAGCGTAASGAADNYDVRVECADAGTNARGENCALWGLTCAEGRCGLERDAASCVRSGCYSSTVIHWCSDGGDRGIDCQSSGQQRCDGFPTQDASQWVACVPESDSDASCGPSTTATCSAGVARVCPAGIPESIACSSLLLPASDAGGCREGVLDPPFDWTSACVVDPPECSSDSCEGAQVAGCERGAVFRVDCGNEGLGPCSMIPTDDGTNSHAACGRR